MRRIRHLLLALLALLLAAPAGAKSFWGPLSPVERAALIDLYEATDGEHWTNNEGWLGPPGTECDWHGISCGCFTVEACPAVYQIDLWWNNLSGYLPRSIRLFRQLQVLNLAVNRLQGEVPGELGKLLRLRELELLANQFTGKIPPELGRLTRLRLLSLGSNDLYGPLPRELANMPHLQQLYLQGNHLGGELPHWVSSWPDLRSLSLGGNEFSGAIPAELFDLERLTLVSLGNNQLTGPIPETFGNHELHAILLQGNRLSGPIPESILRLDFLESANFSWNALYPASPAVERFLLERGAFFGGQTLAPPSVAAVATGPTAARLTWTPVDPDPGDPSQEGGYLVYMKGSGVEDRLRLVRRVVGKAVSMVDVTGLQPGSLYTFRVRTFSKPHKENKNIVWSELSSSVVVTLPLNPPAEGRLP